MTHVIIPEPVNMLARCEGEESSLNLITKSQSFSEPEFLEGDLLKCFSANFFLLLCERRRLGQGRGWGLELANCPSYG